MHPVWDATMRQNRSSSATAFQFMRPRWAQQGYFDFVTALHKFQFMRPRWAQLQDLDSILLYLLYLVYKHHFFIQSYLIITSSSFYFSANTPVFLCSLYIRT